MATSNQGMDYTIVAGADLSACQYSAVTHAGAIAATEQTFGGIIQSKGSVQVVVIVINYALSGSRLWPRGGRG
jgi:hypothetical protein